MHSHNDCVICIIDPTKSRWITLINFKEEPIKVTLIDNPAAGNHSEFSGDQIVQRIRAAGHKVNYQSSKEKRWKKALDKPCDLIAVAGGDGTVGKVARCVIGSRRPIAVLPMGTANNVANVLGVADRPLEELIEGWKTARCVNFDAGLAKGPWGSQHFIEGFGIGLFAETMSGLEGGKIDLGHSDGAKKVVRTVLDILKDRLKDHASQEMIVQLDGQDVSGDYVLLEALNIQHIGPNLDLVPQASINDGFLDVVFVSKRERAKLSKFLADRIKRKNSRANLTVRRGRHLQIEWKNSPIHIDDTTWPKDKERSPLLSNAIDIKIDPGALVFLTPLEKKPRRPRSR